MVWPWEITLTTIGKFPLSVTIFIMHMHILRNGSYANGSLNVLTGQRLKFTNNNVYLSLKILFA